MIDINTLLAAAIKAAIIDALAPFEARLAALEAKSDADTAGIVGLLDVTSPSFVEAVENIAGRIAEEKLDDHTNHYDHDEYDRVVNKVDSLDDVEDTVRDELRSALRSAIDSI
jgi:hypothetical protein